MDPAIFLNPAAADLVAAGPVRVLDRGHVALLHCTGTDALVAHAARASYGREGEPKTPEQDARLVRRLVRDRHTSPVEMPVTWWHVKDPIYTDRQWVRHRMSSRSERSARHTEVPPDEFQQVGGGSWRRQDPDNKQGSSECLDFDDAWEFSADAEHALVQAKNLYANLIEAGVAREQARIVLPETRYTEWVWKIDLHNLLHFLELRLAPDAQQEIREYARAIAAMVERLFPVTWEAFVDYRLEAMTLSRYEIAGLMDAINSVRAMHPAWANITTLDDLLPGKRERAACRAKLARLGLVAEEGGAA